MKTIVCRVVHKTHFINYQTKSHLILLYENIPNNCAFKFAILIFKWYISNWGFFISASKKFKISWFWSYCWWCIWGSILHPRYDSIKKSPLWAQVLPAKMKVNDSNKYSYLLFYQINWVSTKLRYKFVFVWFSKHLLEKHSNW